MDNTYPERNLTVSFTLTVPGQLVSLATVYMHRECRGERAAYGNISKLNVGDHPMAQANLKLYPIIQIPGDAPVP